MEYSHELIMPNDDIPFKLFLFEGKDGHYVREKHWHRSVELFALFEGGLDFYINDMRCALKPGECMKFIPSMRRRKTGRLCCRFRCQLLRDIIPMKSSSIFPTAACLKMGRS